MGLEVLNQSAISENKSSINSSVLGTSNGFRIKLYDNAFYDNNKKYWRANITEFQGIMLDNISIDLNTPWTNAGGAVLGKTIADKVNSKFIKMFAGQSDAGFHPFICSDAWTQQKVGGDASPIKISLKFKAYYKDRLGCSNYKDIIPFLLQICSPMKSASYVKKTSEEGQPDTYEDQYDSEGIASQAKNNVSNAINGLVDTGSTIINGAKRFMDLQKNNVSTSERESAERLVQNVVYTLNNTYNTIVSKTANGKNNANFTVVFSLGDITNSSPNAKKIKNINLKTTELNNNGEAKIQENPIDWIITSFNFKPSTEFFWSNDDKMPRPLWIDFDLSLETRLSLSNAYIYEILNA